MTLLMMILILAAAGVIAYGVSKVSEKAGAAVTIIASNGALLTFLLLGDRLGDSDSFGLISFAYSPLGWYFTVTMMVVYAMVAWFNPYFMKKIVHPSGYNFLYLLSLAGTIGVFFSEHFLVLFIFWEIVVWSSLFIIPFGKSRSASVVYYAMSTFGSFTMLFAIFLLRASYGSFNIDLVLSRAAQNPRTAILAFVLILIAGMVKLGVFPFHIWLPMAHGNAPDTFSPILSGGLVKMGAFAAIMANIMLPANQAFAAQPKVLGIPLTLYIVLILASISIVSGTLRAVAQDDAKKLLAYSSVANAGYIMIGIVLGDNISMNAALMHIFAHAIASAAAFLAIGAVSYRTGTTKMSELGGMIHRMPVTYVVYLIAIISMAGIPPMAGFISKWMLFQSLAKHGLFFVAGAAFFGSVGSFLYVFRPLSAVFLGQLKPEHKELKEAPMGMMIPMIIMSGISIFFGVVPSVLINFTEKINRSLDVVGADKSMLDGLVLKGTNGNLDALLVTIIFASGFFIALMIFLTHPKSKKVGLMDTYTAGEFIYSPELMHYAFGFYAPVERLYEKMYDITEAYKSLVQRIVDLGEFFKALFFRTLPGLSVLWLVVILTLVLWGDLL